MNTRARILIASDTKDAAALVGDMLPDDLGDVSVSTNPDWSVQDFERVQPQVLVLAFKDLAKAQEYCLDLCRRGQAVQAIAHDKLLLCHKDDLWRAYALCKAREFDDYVLFWPMVHDAPRLQMAVLLALRRIAEAGASPGAARALAGHARQLAPLHRQIAQLAEQGGDAAARAEQALARGKSELRDTLHGFSEHLASGVLGDAVEIQDRDVWLQAIDQHAVGPLRDHLDAAAQALRPIQHWAGDMRALALASGAATQAMQQSAGQARPLVLVIEDDPLQRQTLGALLQNEELELGYCGSAVQALAFLHRRRPDLVLMDIGLPGIDGIELTRRIKAVDDWSAIPVLIITGQGDRDAVLESVRVGAAGLLVKPVRRQLLVARIRSCLGDVG